MSKISYHIWKNLIPHLLQLKKIILSLSVLLLLTILKVKEEAGKVTGILLTLHLLMDQVNSTLPKIPIMLLMQFQISLAGLKKKEITKIVTNINKFINIDTKMQLRRMIFQQL